MSSSVTFANTNVTFVLSAGLLKMARASWYIGVIPVPPAMRAMWSCLFADHGYFGIGPLKSNLWPGTMSCMCSDITPLGYFFTRRSMNPCSPRGESVKFYEEEL